MEEKQNTEWEKEFDKWFNHGTKKDPRFAYASSVFDEVKIFVSELIVQERQIAKMEVLDKVEILISNALLKLFADKESINGIVTIPSHDVNVYGNELTDDIEALKEEVGKE